MRIISGKYGRRRFNVPTNITARPTTDFARENIFNVLENLEGFEDKSAVDLFAGTGAVSFEFLSRGCNNVVAVENAPVQAAFIKKVAQILDDPDIHVVKKDVFKFIADNPSSFDYIFADPPYDHPRFEEIPALILNSSLVKPGSIVIIEHSKNRDFSSLPGFNQRRAYGSVNFSIFIIKQPDIESNN